MNHLLPRAPNIFLSAISVFIEIGKDIRNSRCTIIVNNHRQIYYQCQQQCDIFPLCDTSSKFATGGNDTGG
jgi:hypothetical protein